MTTPRFVFQDELCEIIKTHEKSENKRRNRASNREIYSPDRATECERKMLYEIFNGKSDILADCGEDAGDSFILQHKWASLMMRMDGVILHGVSVPVNDAKYNLSGQIDMLLEFENRNMKAIDMVRSVYPEEMSQIKLKGPFRKHVVSDMINMWMIEIPNGIMIYEDQLNKDIEIFHVVAYNPIINRAKEKFLEMERFRMMGQVMDRPHKDPNDKECVSCLFKQKCWEEK